MPLSLLAVALALLVTLLVQPWIPHTQFLLFYVTVAAAAAVGGLPLAVPTIVLSVLAVELFITGGGGIPVLSAELIARSTMLGGVSLAVAALIDSIWRARAESEQAASSLSEQAVELELRVNESEAMASELEDVNQQLAEQTDAARRGVARAERLQRLTALLLETSGEAPVGSIIVNDVRVVVEAVGAAVVLRRPDESLEIVALEHLSRSLLEPLTVGETPVTRVIRSGEALWFADADGLAHEYPSFAGLAAEQGAWVVLPLTADMRTLGVVLLGFEEGGEFRPEDRSFMMMLAHECAQALERARLYEMSMRARIRAEFAERRLAFLADASARLAESLDYHASLERLARMCVPELADCAVVHLLDDNGAPRLVAAVHDEPRLAALCRALEQTHPTSFAVADLAGVLASGAPSRLDEITDERLHERARDDEHLDWLRSFDLHSQVIAPIVIDGAVGGTIILACGASARTFGKGDVTLLVELGRRAGHAVQNARLYEAAQFASEAKSDFLAVISHELRTPLNAIIGYTDLLLLGIPLDLAEPTRHQVERIRNASDGLLQLVEEVLSFSRIEAGKEDLRVSPLDLSELLRACVSMIEPMAAEKSLELGLDLPDAPIQLVSDERKIRQIVTNLLSNAVKFTEDGGIYVSATADDASIRVDFRDTGIGIPTEHLEHIFDPFWQVEHASTRRFGGTGLGLGVARKLARMLDGQLEVRSELGTGSVFTLLLPIRLPLSQRAPVIRSA